MSNIFWIGAYTLGTIFLNNYNFSDKQPFMCILDLLLFIFNRFNKYL